MPIPWNEENAAHLYRRAAFGGTADEILQSVLDGLDLSVDKLLNYQSVPNDLLESRLDALQFYLKSDGKLSDLARWWLIRMSFTSRPLEERMTLFWHDHFATQYSKVLHIGWLRSENDTIRVNATGRFRDLMLAVARDAAMMYFLDMWLSTKTNPNENFARELLELFTLGAGHYAESDVMAATKAFTGWTFNGTTAEFHFNDEEHDYSTKTFLGRTGTWNGDDIIRMACDEFAHGQYIASKLFAFFAYEHPEQAVVDRLARVYLDHDTHLAPLIRAILTSEEMYSPRALWGKVKSPVDHVIIASRQLALRQDVEDAFRYLVQGGQTPFDPPDVAGWEGGSSWITPSALLNRMNFADAATRSFDPVAFTEGERIETPAQLVDSYRRRLGPFQLPPETRAALLSYVSPDGALPTGNLYLTKQRGLARMILSLPEWQMF
ncbi:MAG TPA: DUF1800 domain-containing protein [Thermoanaerobaculia bacterium]|nr:DUF1800 domain-containing protein [Thermoanaerobaculia bacterium]